MIHRQMIEYVNEMMGQMVFHNLVARVCKFYHVRGEESGDNRYGNNYWIQKITDDSKGKT